MRWFIEPHIEHSVASLTAAPGVTSSVLAWSHTFVEIDHEIISTVILLLLNQVGFLLVTRESMCMKYLLTAQSSLLRNKCGEMN